MGNPGATLSAYRDMQSQARLIIDAAKHGPLQSLTDREMDVREQPMTICPRPKRVRVWVRFDPEAVRVDAKLIRSTPLAAGIEFRAGEQTFRCWVWGNAVELDAVESQA
jgi:hypothetical protein